MSGEVRRLKETAPKRYRALFISDVHLGKRGCQADSLLDFMRHREANTIYLVGDIIDLRSPIYWPQRHNDVVQKLLHYDGRVIYVPGNRDKFLRGYFGTHFGNIEVVENIVHEGADGRRYLVVHGDTFDRVVRHKRLLVLLGDRAYKVAAAANRVLNAFRRVLPVPNRLVSKRATPKQKNSVKNIAAFKKALGIEAQRYEADGVICGHIHTAAIHDDCGIRYINCGDWVESCTAAVEHHDGKFEIISWTKNWQPASRPRISQ
jgi:UDP-2,3-diacylglucosamine pyrophosphatase LpxH